VVKALTGAFDPILESITRLIFRIASVLRRWEALKEASLLLRMTLMRKAVLLSIPKASGLSRYCWIRAGSSVTTHMLQTCIIT